jgi:hypothetical protein
MHSVRQLLDRREVLAIPESQLETWSHRPQTDTAVRAHEAVRGALRKPSSSVAGIDFEDYLQGSYRNDTNIYGDYDVDIVIQLNGSFFYGIDRLSESDQARYRRTVIPATYKLDTFRAAVMATLRAELGAAAVTDDNKVIHVAGKSGVRLDADVLVAEQYRDYVSFDGSTERGYIEGIKFWAQDDERWIVNYPKLHYENGVAKQKETGDWFKPTVRTFKNIRNYLVDRNLIPEDAAASYFIQGMLYNVPRPYFGLTHRQNFEDVLEWLSNAIDSHVTFVCQNGIVPLFGYTPEQWNTTDMTLFLRAIRDLDRAWM